MIRLGIVDFDTSHTVAFTQRLNHLEASEDQWVEGADLAHWSENRGTETAVLINVEVFRVK